MNKTKIFFDIYWENEKECRGDLIILYEKGKHNIYPAISGPHGKGSLERGEYHIVSCLNLEDTVKNNPYKREGIPWIAGIKPQFDTERNNLAIHPDGNVKGSLGCIAITERDLYAYVDIYRLLKADKQIKMKVI